MSDLLNRATFCRRRIIKLSLDKAAETAVAQQALKVIDVMAEINSASAGFESYLEAVLSQSPHEVGAAAVGGEQSGVRYATVSLFLPDPIFCLPASQSAKLESRS